MITTNRHHVLAFSAPAVLVKRTIPIRSNLTKRRIRRILSPNRVEPATALARGRIDPQDEAFVTCPSCGSDSPVSATKILQKGTIAIRCTQCNTNFTGRAEDALTIMGKKLTAASVSGGEVEGEEESVRRDVVKLYISGLPPKTDSVALRNALEEFGAVLSANVIYDRVTGRSRGFGFVTIVGRSSATAAIDVLSGDSTRLGRRLNVREAIDR